MPLIKICHPLENILKIGLERKIGLYGFCLLPYILKINGCSFDGKKRLQLSDELLKNNIGFLV